MFQNHTIRRQYGVLTHGRAHVRRLDLSVLGHDMESVLEQFQTETQICKTLQKYFQQSIFLS